MDQRLRMGIAERENVGADAIDEGGMQDVEPFRSTQRARLRRAAKRLDGRDRAINGSLVAAADRAAYPVQQTSLRFVNDVVRNIAGLRVDDKLGQRPSDVNHTLEECNPLFVVSGASRRNSLRNLRPAQSVKLANGIRFDRNLFRPPQLAEPFRARLVFDVHVVRACVSAKKAVAAFVDPGSADEARASEACRGNAADAGPSGMNPFVPGAV